MTRNTKRFENAKTLQVSFADKIWSELSSEGSIRQSRRISWPIPKFLYEEGAAERQLKEGYIAEPKYPAVPIPIDWADNPFRDKPWMNRLMCLQPMDAYVIGLFEGDESLFSKAKDIYFSWCYFHLIEKRTNYLSWYDMPVGYRALKTALILSWALEGKITLNQEEQRLLVLSAEVHMQELMRPNSLSKGNHGIFQMYGLAVLSQMFWPLPLSIQAQRYAQKVMLELVDLQFNDEGVHLEHSPHYHQWMITELQTIADSGWIDLKIDRRLQKARSVSGWLVEPTGCPVRVGDTASFSRWPLAVNAAPADNEANGLQSKWFRKGGYAIGRTSSGQVFFQGSYHSKAHKHADDMHFDWFDLGRRILVDSGANGYKGGDERAYFLSSAAHNSIVVDDQSHPRDGTDAYGSCIQMAHAYDNCWYLKAFINHRSMAWTHSRELHWTPGKCLLIDDYLESTSGLRTYAQWFHFAPEFRKHTDSLFCDGSIHVSIKSLNHYFWRKGESDPMIGWRGDGLGRITPAWSGYAKSIGPATRFTTEFSIAQAPEDCRRT